MSHGEPPGPELVPVEKHQLDTLAAIRPLQPLWLPLDEAEGGVLAEDVLADTPLPPFDNSAMDGYAVHAADVAGATAEAPVTLPVGGEVAAGDTGSYRVEPGSCLRIMTGALLPAGADAVVPVEQTDGGTTVAAFSRAVSPGESVRRQGDDVPAGARLLESGTPVGPVQLALLAGSGHATVLVRPRPRVAVVSTGNELAEPGTPLVPGQIWESNSYLLAAAARQAGAVAARYRLPDNPDAVLARLEQLLPEADLLVTSGGVSMGGEHDVVKAALSKLGTVRFRKVAMQPGMPQGFGVLGPEQRPLFTLPGNPVSAYVSFLLFVRPALNALRDLPVLRQRGLTAALTADVRSPQNRRSYLRGVLDDAQETVAPLTGQSSHQLSALAQANALIIVPEPVTRIEAGQPVDVMVLP
jgi:molybdopterin molybdotransferase